jgi:ABC-type transport system involved in cytochrome c biogenesis permease subunit
MNIVLFEEVTFTISFLFYIAASLSFFVYLVGGKEKAGKFAVNASTAGFIVHTLAMILRIAESGRLPFSNQFEFASSFTWGIVLCYLVIHYYYKFTSVGAFVMPLAFLMMGYASVLPNKTFDACPSKQLALIPCRLRNNILWLLCGCMRLINYVFA